MMKKRRRRVQIRKKPKSIGVQEAISEYPEAYHSGYDEAKKNSFPDDNPYPEGSSEWKAWAVGWNEFQSWIEVKI